MDKYLEADERVYLVAKRLKEWFEKNRSSWAEYMNTECAKPGNVRAFQTFFNSVDDCISPGFQQQSLRLSDIKQMYPRFLDQVLNTKSPNFVYFFTCCDALGPGKCLKIVSTI